MGKIKAQEREAKAQYSLLDDIPATLPALMKAEKMQKRCASVGFDWHELSPVLDKVYEEIDEVMAEVKKPLEMINVLRMSWGICFFCG